MRLTRVAGTLLALCLPAAALGAQRIAIQDTSFNTLARVRSEAPFIAAVQRIGCMPLALPSPSSAPWTDALYEVALPVQARSIGPLPQTRVTYGAVIETVVRTPQYQFSRINTASRVGASRTFAYMMEPAFPVGSKPIVILLHGSGTLPHQAFGLRLAGEQGQISRPDSTPFIGMGLALARAGFTVIAPVLGITPPTKEGLMLPWLDENTWGELLHEKLGQGGTETIMVSEIQSFIDFATTYNLGLPGQVYIVGWKEGAYLGALAAAVDDRVRGLVRLGSPFDRRAYRNGPGMFRGAGFAQADCRMGDVAQAALLKGKPQMYVSAVDDVEEMARKPFRSAAIVDSVRAVYAANGAADRLDVHITDAPTRTVQAEAAAWLARLAKSLPSSTALHFQPPAVPQSFTFPQNYVAERASLVSAYVGNVKVCKALPLETVAEIEPEDAARRILSLLDAASPRRPTARILSRTVIDSSRGYRLSLVDFGSKGAPPYRALLAEPFNAPEASTPAVLAFNGNDDLNDLFAIAPPKRGIYVNDEYLNGYADVLAKRGFVVFAPIIPYWLPDAGAALSAARSGGRSSVWRMLIDAYSSALDVVTTIPTVDREQIAAYGISFAGTAASIMTAVDQRIRALVYNNIPTDAQKVFNSAAGAYTNLWAADACGVMDAALVAIAPRPFLWEAGEDPLMLNENMYVVARVRDRYVSLGIGENFSFTRHYSGHTTHPYDLKIFGR